MRDNFFAPSSRTVPVGTTVTWTNFGSNAHTATADNGEWNTSVVAKGNSGSITFSAPGTYAYTCLIHPGEMRGTLVVE
ncbi:MAG: cupredoxin domain-containing protein [Chloroflexi bacterium]|nr:cupredoxin domain-containing protein [Chloroflexota bacterium]